MSASSGRWASAVCRRGTHSASSAVSGVLSVIWYWARLMRSSMESSCTGWNQTPIVRRSASGRSAIRRRSRSMMASTSSARSSCDFRFSSMRPVLSAVLLPSTPMNDDRLATSGSSSSWRATASCCFFMASNEMVPGACVTTWMTPLSCTGKKPLGTSR